MFHAAASLMLFGVSVVARIGGGESVCRSARALLTGFRLP